MDWTPTINLAARTDCSYNNGLLMNHADAYPFAPNINFDFERGLLKRVTNYNNSGIKVSETLYNTYQRTNAPEIVYALRTENNAYAKAYAKYAIYTNVHELNTEVINTTYDSATASQTLQTTTDYSFNGLQHKLLTGEQMTNSNGDVITKHIKYVRDYTVASSTDSATNALYLLQQQHINIPVETYTQIQHTGGVTKTINADLIKFKDFSLSNAVPLVMPTQKLKIIAPDGLTDFQSSYIASGIITKDSRYVAVENDLEYDSKGKLLTFTNENKLVRSVFYDQSTGMPVASLKNAVHNEVAFTDFDSDIYQSGFTKDNNNYSYTANSRTGQRALSLEASATLSKAIIKNSRTRNYLFSIWVNSATGGSVNVNVIDNNNQSNSAQINYTATNGAWKYYEVKVPIANLAANLTLRFSSTADITIDDVLFYPENAEANTIAYDNITHVKAAETNSNGVSSYFVSDKFGRLNYVYDQDKQLVLRKTYVNTSTYVAFPYTNLDFSFSPARLIHLNEQISFTPFVPGCELTGAVYTWNFGDGSPLITTYSPTSPSHSYTQVGSYTVTLSVNANNFQKAVIHQLTISPSPNVFLLNESGDAITIKFYQNSQLMYTFTSADFASGPATIPTGNYNVEVYVIQQRTTSSPPDGSVQSGVGQSTPVDNIDAKYLREFNTGQTSCNAYSGSGHFSYTVSLSGSSTVSFTLNDQICQ